MSCGLTMKKKVLIIGPLTSGGRERRMAQLVVGLDAFPDCETLLLSPNDTIDYSEVLTSHARIVTLTSLKGNTLKDSLDSVISEFKPDIVHLWIEEIHWFKAIQSFRCKYHFKYIAGFVATSLPVRFLSNKHLSLILGYWRADAIVSNSAAGIKARRVPRRHAHVIPNGFSFARFENLKSREEMRRDLNLEDKLAVLMVARFEKEKDWDLFFDLAARTKHLDIKYLAVGTGTLFDEYVHKANEYNLRNIEFLGRRSDVENILLACDVSVQFTAPPVAEGFSNSILESMAARLPVIATGTGGTPELVEHGKTGFLIGEKDLESANSYIVQLYSDTSLRSRMGEAAKKRVEEAFSLELMTKRYVELYQSLI